MKLPVAYTIQNANVPSHLSGTNCLNYYLYRLSNSIPLQAWTGPKVSIRLRLPSHYSGSLRARRSGDGNPVGARFSTTVQTGPGAHAAS